jgi:hypothetical protein
MSLARRLMTRTGLAAQSAFAPEKFTTLAHFSVLSTMSRPKSPGEPASTVADMSASRALMAGSASARLNAWLSLSMISMGVFRGAPTPWSALGRPEPDLLSRVVMVRAGGPLRTRALPKAGRRAGRWAGFCRG